LTWLDLPALAWLGLIPVVVLLYFMKLRRSELKVSAAFLWRRALQEARVDRFSSRLRANLLLLFQILCIIVLALSLARPARLVPGSEARLVVLVMDTSASMQADQGGRTRFDLARRKALEIVEGAPSGTAFLLIAAARQARLQSPLSPDKTLIREALQRLTPQDSAGDLASALNLAASLSRQRSAAIYLFSDHAPQPTPMGDLPESLVYLPVGTPLDNTAITAFTLEDHPRGSRQVFAMISNFSSQAVETTAHLTLDGKQLESRRLILPRGRRQPLSFQLPVAASGILELAIEPVDALPLDNRATAYLSSSSTTNVLLVSRGNPFLERLLGLLPGIVSTTLSPQSFTRPPPSAVVILDDVSVKSLPPGNYLVFHSLLPNNLIPVNGEIKQPGITQWNRDHPLLRQLSLGEISISSARRLVPDAAVQPLVESDSAPLVILLERGPLRCIYVAFDLYASDWLLRPSFPVFMARALEWLGAGASIHPQAMIRTGEPIDPGPMQGNETLRITLPPSQPGGRPKTREISAPGLFTDTGRAGIYRITRGNESWSVAANLLDSDESDLAVIGTDKSSTSTASPPTATAQSGRMPRLKEFWPNLLLLALGLLTLEWYWYTRRMK